MEDMSGDLLLCQALDWAFQMLVISCHPYKTSVLDCVVSNLTVEEP